MAEDKLSGDDKAEDKQQKQSGLFKWYFWSFGFVLLSVLGYLGFLIYVSWPISTYSIDKSALLGDSFGILSSLFSGLAFAGLIVTLAMQRKTLDAQMEELALARQEYKRQGDALKGQEAVMSRQFEAIRLQSYEGTLNRLLDLKEAVMKEKINLNSRNKQTLKNLIVEHFLDNKKVVRGVIFLERNYEFSLYFKRVISIIKLANKNKNIGEGDFFFDLARSAFRKEEVKMLLWLIEKEKYQKYGDEISSFFDDLDGFSLFSNNFSLDEVFEDKGEVEFGVFEDDNNIIDVIFNFIDHKNQSLSFKFDVLERYIEILQHKIFEIEMFGLNNGDTNRNELDVVEDIRYRISEIENKKVGLTAQ